MTKWATLRSLIDEYVGVSNTNMYVREGVAKSGRVRVPFFHRACGGCTRGMRRPWFEGFTDYRGRPVGDWKAPLDKRR